MRQKEKYAPTSPAWKEVCGLFQDLKETNVATGVSCKNRQDLSNCKKILDFIKNLEGKSMFLKEFQSLVCIFQCSL